jgi:purine-binding chemotaxis protein CheW
LYVVDTAKYIMPEKGYDLERDGFAYLIQLQHSKWTLACKQVHTTVRVEPDHVKWRSSEGKRQWLSGTIIEHMCALIHVDKLVDILNANA